MSMIRNHFFRKTGERFFVGEITCKIASGLFINYTYNSALLLKLIGNTFANPLYAASDDGDFVMEHFVGLLCISWFDYSK